jgi:uncharacterized protein YbjT (DUF2867 family)
MYVIAGVSGNTGRFVASALLAQGAAVRVLVRDAAKGEEWKKRGAEVAVAELDDAPALAKALRGAKGTYLLLPPQPASSDSRADNAKRTKALVAAIEESGVPHVVFLSSIAAHVTSGTGPILSLHDAEIALRRVKADVTFVRAGYFMENLGASLYALAQGAFPTFLEASRPVAMVATADIGKVAADALLAGGQGKTVIELTGPREYTPVEVAKALSDIVGKPITLQVGPVEAMQEALVGAGLNAHWAGLYQEMTRALNSGHLTWEGTKLVRGSTPVESVLKSLTAG